MIPQSWIDGAYCGWWCPKGWDTLVADLCSRMVAHLKAAGLDENAIVVAQVKEKFGGLRFYWDVAYDETGIAAFCYDSELSQTLRSLVVDAERASRKTCQNCSAPGVEMERKGWYVTMCQDCAPPGYFALAKND